MRGVDISTAQIIDAAVSIRRGLEQTDVDRAAIDDKKLVRAGIRPPRASIPRHGMRESETLASIETDVELVAVHDVKRAVVVECGMRNDEIRSRAERHRMFDSRPVHAEVACLADIEIAIARIRAIGWFRPIKRAIGPPRSMTAGLMFREQRIGHARVGRVVRRMRVVPANNMIRAAAIIADERCLNWISQPSIETKNQ